MPVSQPASNQPWAAASNALRLDHQLGLDVPGRDGLTGALEVHHLGGYPLRGADVRLAGRVPSQQHPRQHCFFSRHAAS